MRRRITSSLLLLPAASAVATAAIQGSSPLTISHRSPIRNCQDGQSRDVVPEAEVEPSLAIDPTRPDHLVAVFQQDRFRNGAARAIAASVSMDGGRTWTERVLPVGLCATHRPGPFRVTDPWVSIGGDGHVYALASAFALSSGDGGKTWPRIVELDRRTERYFLDKGSLTADPAEPGTAYATWARYAVPRRGPPVHSDAMLSVTTNGGRTWSAPRAMLHGGADSGPIASAIVPGLRRGELYHFAFFQIGAVPSMAHPSSIVVQASSDGGRTWSVPRTVAKALTVAEEAREPYSGTQIRTGFVVPAFARARARCTSRGRMRGSAIAATTRSSSRGRRTTDAGGAVRP